MSDIENVMPKIGYHLTFSFPTLDGPHMFLKSEKINYLCKIQFWIYVHQNPR